MARRPAPIKAFVRTQRSSDAESESTALKSVWSPPPSLQSLVNKVGHLEERLDHLETLISQRTDLTRKRQEQEELEQSRQELEDMRRQLDDAVQRLQQREADLNEAQNTLDNLANQTAQDREKIHTLEVEKTELHQLIMDLEIKLNERVRKVGLLEKQVGNMQKALNHTNNQVVMLQQQMAKMQQQMNAIAGTAPANQVPAAMPCQRPINTPQGGRGGGGGGGGGDSSPQTDRGGASPKHHTGTLGLPPISVPSQPAGGRVSARGNVRYNFPPKR